MNRCCGCIRLVEMKKRWQACPQHKIIVHYYHGSSENSTWMDMAECTICGTYAHGETLQEAADNLIAGIFQVGCSSTREQQEVEHVK